MRLMLAAVLLVAGCRTTRVVDGASTAMAVPGGTRVVIADLLARAMLNRGFQVRELGPKDARFARVAETGAEFNVRYKLSDVRGGAQISARLDSGDDLGKVQEILAAIRDRVARQAAQAAAVKPAASKPAGEERPAPKPARKARRAQPAEEEKPKASPGSEDDVIRQMQKRALGQ